TQIDPQEVIDGHYYRLLQFYELPNNAQHQWIAQQGVQLLEYLPHLTYIAAIPAQMDLALLETIGVRSVLTLSAEMKLGISLIERPFGEWAVFGSQINVMLKFHKNLKQNDLTHLFDQTGIQVLRSNGVNNFVLARIEQDQIEQIASLPFVAYLELEAPPAVPDDTEGRSLHRASAIDTGIPGGRKYTGEGVKVQCRDDGDVGPHIDFQGRQNSEFVGTTRGTHGDGVSGIMCGAGNLNPKNRGMAAGATLYVTDYEASFLDNTLQLHTEENVLVTNSSYSNGCNEGYTESTATVDQQMNDNPSYLHVFSAGNSNNQDCGYGAGTQWGNITGGHKQGKNVIATANVFSDGSLVESSSRGPAHDGRIKPDIAANGQDQISTDPNNEYDAFGGTSGAAPGIAGIAAQLHQAYSEHNGGATADAALIKAILLNSANDYGNVGPDFKFGWGIVNAYRAALTIEEGRYLTSSVDPGMTQTHDIEVPAGVSQIKVMTYWRERESALLTTKSLINNIDTRLTATTGIHEPWAIDPTPNPASLDLPALKGTDDLNNVEQVVVDMPFPGTYTLEVTGTELPFGTHDYIVVYEFLSANPTITYPVGGEGFVPGEVERIHWDAHGDQGNFIIVYSIDSGNSWLVVDNVSGDQRMYEWTVPDEFTGLGKVMIVRGPAMSISEDFTIAGQPQNLQVSQVCPDYIQLSWEEVPGAGEYEVFVLGEKYMDPVGTSTALTFDFPITDPSQSYWFAVRTLGADNLVSRRTEAIFYDGGLQDCVLATDLSINAILSPSTPLAYSCAGAFDGALTVQVTNNGTSMLTDAPISVNINGTLIDETIGGAIMPGETIDYTFTTPAPISSEGVYEVTFQVAAQDDEYAGNDAISTSIVVVSGSGAGNPFQEDFESGVFPPADWSSIDLDDDIGWEATEVVQKDGEMGTAMYMHNYFYASAEVNAQEDMMYMLPVDLTGAPNDVGLLFDLAYSQYSTFFGSTTDRLKIELSTDCGNTFPIVLYDKTGMELESVPGQFGEFIPQVGTDWKSESVDLGNYIGSTIVIRFVHTSNFGNNLFIDNVNVTGLTPQAALEVSQDVICRGETLEVTSISQGGDLDYFWDFG
ncbi:MAG: S8 family serine peptidase, partial [Bacteroidota bacterium]